VEPVTLLIALVAGGAVLLIVYALSGSAPVDPVQARLTQLGTMEAKNLEELELQAPFIERTLRPLGAALSNRLSRSTNQSFTDRTEKRLALAGNPGEIRTADWLAVKVVGAVIGAIVFWGALLVFVTAATHVLQLTLFTDFLARVVGYLPTLAAGIDPVRSLAASASVLGGAGAGVVLLPDNGVSANSLSRLK